MTRSDIVFSRLLASVFMALVLFQGHSHTPPSPTASRTISDVAKLHWLSPSVSAFALAARSDNSNARSTGGSPTSALIQEDTVPLVSGMPAPFSIPAPQLGFCELSDTQYSIHYPGGLTRLKIELSSDFSARLYVRRGQRVTAEGDRVVSDSELTLGLNPQSSFIPMPGQPLPGEGTYFIAVETCRKEGTSGTITATLSGPPDGETVPINFDVGSGGLQIGSAPAPVPGSCLSGQTQYTIQAPEPSPCGAIYFSTITLMSDQNVNLYVRHGQRVTVENGNIMADFVSASPTGTEAFHLFQNSPTYKGGTYYFAIENCSSAE